VFLANGKLTTLNIRRLTLLCNARITLAIDDCVCVCVS